MLKQLALSTILFASPAFGMDHSYYFKMRPSYQKNFFLTGAVQAAKSTINNEYKSQQISGYSLQTSIGREYFRFLKVGLGAALVDQSDKSNLTYSFVGQEIGPEVRFVFSSPVANLVLGGAYFGTNKRLNAQILNGQGYRLMLELDHYIATNVNLVGSASLVKEEYRSFKVDGQRYGFGINLWL